MAGEPGKASSNYENGRIRGVDAGAVQMALRGACVEEVS